jgi:hypothetical protein
MTSKNKVFA